MFHYFSGKLSVLDKSKNFQIYPSCYQLNPKTCKEDMMHAKKTCKEDIVYFPARV